MQVIPEWMGKWGIKAPKAELWNDPYFPPAKDLLGDLDRRFKAAFQEDEAVRADLLAACAKLRVNIARLLLVWEETAGILRRLDLPNRCDIAISHMEPAIVDAKATGQ